MNRYSDIDPRDIDPDTGRPYSNYSSDSLDTSFHDGEMDVDDDPADLEAERFAADPLADMVRAKYPRLARSYPHIFGEQP